MSVYLVHTHTHTHIAANPGGLNMQQVFSRNLSFHWWGTTLVGSGSSAVPKKLSRENRGNGTCGVVSYSPLGVCWHGVCTCVFFLWEAAGNHGTGQPLIYCSQEMCSQQKCSQKVHLRVLHWVTVILLIIHMVFSVYSIYLVKDQKSKWHTKYVL